MTHARHARPCTLAEQVLGRDATWSRITPVWIITRIVSWLTWAAGSLRRRREADAADLAATEQWLAGARGEERKIPPSLSITAGTRLLAFLSDLTRPVPSREWLQFENWMRLEGLD